MTDKEHNQAVKAFRSLAERTVKLQQENETLREVCQLVVNHWYECKGPPFKTIAESAKRALDNAKG